MSLALILMAGGLFLHSFAFQPPGPSSAYQEAVLRDAPRAFWRLSEGLGSVAVDISGKNVSGTYRGGIDFESSGFTDDDLGSVSLNGTGGHIRAGDVFDFPLNAAFSIELWIYPSGEDFAYRRIVSKEDSSGEGYSLWLQPDEAVTFQRSSGSQIQMARFDSLPPAQWSHVVGTYDGATLRLYVNGVLRDKLASRVSLDGRSAPFVVGKGASWESDHYSGRFDEVAVYDRTLTSGRIGAHFNAAQQRTNPMLTAPTSSTLRVVGNGLRDAGGRPLLIHGVNLSGHEFPCVQGWGTFQGPVDLSQVRAMQSWRVNAVNLLLNESCWLGIRGVSRRYSGEDYRQAVEHYVNLLTENGIVAILRLQWVTEGQPPMPDRRYAPRFWASVANRFKSNGLVMFDLYGEPHPDDNKNTVEAWRCWRDGGRCRGVRRPAAGTQEMVNAIRSTGAINPLIISGVQWGGNLSRWLEYKPYDPQNALIAAAHIYDFQVCTNRPCWNIMYGPVADKVPMIAGELGEHDSPPCGNGSFAKSAMKWLDANNVGYMAWTWNRWDDYCMSLIRDWHGTPTIPYGRAVRAHYLESSAVAPPG